MAYIDDQLLQFKNTIENAIVEGGTQGKASAIRSSVLINLIHDAVKYEFIERGINPQNIYPHHGEKKGELKLAGFLKQKKQDICIVPSGINKVSTKINWGHLHLQTRQILMGWNSL